MTINPTHNSDNRPHGLPIVFPNLGALYEAIGDVLPLAAIDEDNEGQLVIYTALKSWSDNAITYDPDAIDWADGLPDNLNPQADTLATQLADSLDAIDPATDVAALADIARTALDALAVSGWETSETIEAARYLRNIANITRNN
jgi:hypothetical protein